ncbi:MAG: serine O-acetyltransferase, partial [Sphingomonas sp.]
LWWWRTCRAFGSEIAIGATVEGGLYVPHPYGIVIGVAMIGHDVTILQNVTIGNRGEAGTPGAVIGDGAYLGAGAAVIGAVTIGARARVGANAVVTRDVPPGATAVGIPARARR